jgi:hypothetical protein
MNELLIKRLAHHGLLSKNKCVLDSLYQTVGIQAQAQREAELNLALRTENLNLTTLSNLYQEEKIVRAWANRWTLHLFTYDDWKLLINARQNEQLPASYFSGEKELGLIAVKFITAHLKVQKSLSKSEVESLILSEFPNFNMKSYLMHAVLQTLFQQGICYFDATTSAQNYRLVFAEHFKCVPAEQAIEQLISRYLTGFAPTSLEDFVKWSGLKISSVRKIWQRMNLSEFDKAIKIDLELIAEKTIIAARFDSLLTGYVDKTWLTPLDKIDLMWTKNGFLLAPIIYDGKLVGRWNYKILKSEINFLVEYWSPVNDQQLEEKFTEIAQFLEKNLNQIRYIRL